MKRADVDTFEKLVGQLNSIYREITALSRKSSNDSVNKFKLKFVNVTIEQCNQFLGTQYRPFAEFTVFSEDDIPSNSDVSFVISQYLECAEKFRADHIQQDEWKGWLWKLDREEGKLKTAPPKKLREK
jgi:hypothetical protein